MFDNTAREEVRSRIDIATVIGRYVNLRPSGNTLKGLCPFHKEKTPSFHVNPAQGYYHCFGCGKGGDVFSFVQEIEGVDFPEALTMLAEECGVTVERVKQRADYSTSPGSSSNAASGNASLTKTDLLRIHQVAAAFFYRSIRTSPAAIEYLKTRGLRAETVRDFRLGFAPGGWNALIEHCKKERISEEALCACGLAVKKESGGYYDRFRNRVMFSLCDLSGRVIGFAGRGMEEQTTPKYLNSPETALYKKKNFLYGLGRAREAIKELGYVIVVEGYMDYLTLYQAGIRNVTASSGTALTEEHGRILKRFTGRVILNFDGDNAGQNAAERAIFTLAPLDLDLSVLILPENEDPDSLVKNSGKESFEAYINRKIPWDEFIIDRMISRYDPTTAMGKSAVVDALAPLAALLRDPIVSHHFRQLLSEKLGLAERLVNAKLPAAKTSLQIRSSAILNDDMRFTTSLEGRFLRCLLLKPELIAQARTYVSPETLTDTISSDIYSLLLECYDRDGNANGICDLTAEPEIKRRISLLQVKEDAQEHIHEELVQKIVHLRKKYLYHRLRECTMRMKREPHLLKELQLLQRDISIQLKELDGGE